MNKQAFERAFDLGIREAAIRLEKRAAGLPWSELEGGGGTTGILKNVKDHPELKGIIAKLRKHEGIDGLEIHPNEVAFRTPNLSKYRASLDKLVGG